MFQILLLGELLGNEAPFYQIRHGAIISGMALGGLDSQLSGALLLG
jgi:hypothetical protein